MVASMAMTYAISFHVLEFSAGCCYRGRDLNDAQPRIVLILVSAHIDGDAAPAGEYMEV